MKEVLKEIIEISLCVVFASPALAQETDWGTLNARVEELFGKRQYDEALPIAQKALEVATETFGPDHLNVATSLNPTNSQTALMRGDVCLQGYGRWEWSEVAAQNTAQRPSPRHSTHRIKASTILVRTKGQIRALVLHPRLLRRTRPLL